MIDYICSNPYFHATASTIRFKDPSLAAAKTAKLLVIIDVYREFSLDISHEEAHAHTLPAPTTTTGPERPHQCR